MKCPDFEVTILRLARGELMDPTMRQHYLTHAESCTRCGHRLAEEQALFAGIRVVAGDMALDGASPQVETSLLAAFQQQVRAAKSPIIVPLWTRTLHSRPWGLLTAAALVLLTFSVIMIRWLQPSQPTAHQGSQVINTRAPVDQTQVAHVSTDREPNVSSQTANTSPQSRFGHRRNRTAKAEIVTEFFALEEGADLDSLEIAQVVRVELPGSALADVGLAVDPEVADKPVKADVALGYDGIARAIRFVR